GDQPLTLDEQARDPVRQILHLAIGPGAGVVEHRERFGILFVDQLDRSVEAFRVLQLRQGEEEFWLRLQRGEAVANEGVDHSGTTAMVSISIFARGSTRAVTPTTAMAGKFL